MTRLTTAALRVLLEGKRLLIFDFDGTLADTSALHEAAFNAVLMPWSLRIDYPAIAGMRTRDAFAACFGAARVDVQESQLQELVRSKQTYVRTLIQRELRPLPGVDDFLRWAKSRYRLALYTSGSRGTVAIAMERLGYTGWFDPMLCAEDVSRAKPDPEGFQTILELTGARPREALIFEDSNSGIAAAGAIGCDALRMASTSEDNAPGSVPSVAWHDLLRILKLPKESKRSIDPVLPRAI